MYFTWRLLIPHGRLINSWSWPVKSPAQTTNELLNSGDNSAVSLTETGESLILSSGEVSIELNKADGSLKQVKSGQREIPLSEGPLFRSDSSQLKTTIRHFAGDKSYHVLVDYGKAGTLEWVMHEGGLVDMNLRYQPEPGPLLHTGASFSYPESAVQSVSYLGNGPYRVWKNRMAGVGFNVWDKEYNNSITGHSDFIYPEFKGYYSNLYWARIYDQQDHHFTVYSHTEDLFLRLFTPEEAPQPARTTVSHPPGNLSFMLGIPPIGTKFKDAEELGPQSGNYHYLNRRVKGGALQIELTFDFR